MNVYGEVKAQKEKSKRITEPSVNSLYYWGVGDYQKVASDELLIFCGEGEMKDETLVFSRVNLPPVVPKLRRVIAVLRFSPRVLSELLKKKPEESGLSSIRKKLETVSKWAGTEVELQIDADCPRSLFKEYCRWIRILKSKLSNQISVTCIGSWLSKDTIIPLADLNCDLYLMLYTMAPSPYLKNWGGEVPLKLWGEAMEALSVALKKKWVSSQRVVVVLPVYSLVTAYDDKGLRMWRGTPVKSLSCFEPQNKDEGLRPYQLSSETAFGKRKALEVVQTRIIGDLIYRAGSVLISENFSFRDWCQTAKNIEAKVGKIRLGLYHCGEM